MPECLEDSNPGKPGLDAEEDDSIGITGTLDRFREYNEVKQMIDDIPVVATKFLTTEKAFEDLKTLLDQYQEQPHLLDSHIHLLLNQLLDIVCSKDLSDEAIVLGFQYLWLIVKVRGYKTVIKKMPHEVKHLLLVLNLLEKQGLQQDFYGSYVLLMWLSIIIYMPFDLKGFDQTVHMSSSIKAPTVVDRILVVIKMHLQSPQTSRDMAAYLASRYVTRPDLREKYLPEFIDYFFEVLEKSDPKAPQTLFHKMGVLRALGLIFKHGKREELCPYAPTLLKKFIGSELYHCQDTPLKKYSMKLVQRLGLTLLKPKVASWRYQRGSRSLVINLNSGKEKEVPKVTSCVGDDDDNDIPPEIEDIIDFLLQGLKDKDTVVRWSAAKGIGRITGRLPRSLADDVVGAILEQFSIRESDKAWHGGCLALAELARRGLLLPERLPAVMPVLEKALVFDELRGQSSVGSNIRDAACYLCWAFARAYHPDQLKPYVSHLATGLLIVALFDREIPCRRAGSAAFQEFVGRQGSFPHGIEIITCVDYFAVGNRANAYLNLSVFVAKHKDYTNTLIDHLIDKKIGHWDSAIRELSAKALHNLTFLSPDYVGKEILPILLKQTIGTSLVSRHGCLLAVGNIFYALSLEAKKSGDKLNRYVDMESLVKINSIVSTLNKNKLYRGMGGEYMRQATSVFLEKCSLAEIPMEGHRDVVDEWHDILEDCAIHFEDNVRLASLNALSALWAQYYDPNSPSMAAWRDDLVAKYIKGQKCEREAHSLGYVAALGHMPRKLLNGKLDIVLDSLVGAMEITSSTTKWAPVRKEAINSIVRVAFETGFESDGSPTDCLCTENVHKIFMALIEALDDYTMDRRGDIGAWVREASMTAIQTLVPLILEKDPRAVSSVIVAQLMPKICQQSVERIDRTRKVAGVTFYSLLHCETKLENIPDRDFLVEAFPLEWCQKCNWASESSSFNKFVDLLDLPTYRPRVLLGLMYSLGGVSANLSRYTLEALQKYLYDRMTNTDLMKNFFLSILILFEDFQNQDRLILPLIKSLSNLLSSCSALDSLLEEDPDLVKKLLTCLKRECFKCSDYHKLSSTVSTLCELLRLETGSTKAILTQLTIFLGFQYPKVRAITATSLLTTLQDYSDREIVPEEHLTEVISILEDTSWMDSMEDAREKRNQFCLLTNIPFPQARKLIGPK